MLELPEPPKTIDGKHYKVPIKEYKEVKATAGQVNEIRKSLETRKKAQDNKAIQLNERSKELDEREKEIERGKKLPIKERMELLSLRVLRKSVTWLAEQPIVPEKVRNLLKRALGGEDLTQTHGMEQPHKIREIAR